jgi:hypothetical protein
MGGQGLFMSKQQAPTLLTILLLVMAIAFESLVLATTKRRDLMTVQCATPSK